MGGDTVLEKMMTTCYGLQKMIEIQSSSVVKLQEVVAELEDMQEATGATQENIKDGVAHVVCACSQAISVKAR
jgi:hypothetical protein